jgi:hypothetical protein
MGLPGTVAADAESVNAPADRPTAIIMTGNLNI